MSSVVEVLEGFCYAIFSYLYVLRDVCLVNIIVLCELLHTGLQFSSEGCLFVWFGVLDFVPFLTHRPLFDVP